MSEFTPESTWRRLHFWGGVLTPGRVFNVVMFCSIGFLVFGTLALVVSLVGVAGVVFWSATKRYWTNRYRFDQDQVVVESGFWHISEIVVPFKQLHNIDLVQNSFQKWIGVAKLQLQTSSEATVELNGISLENIEELRSLLRTYQEEHSHTGEEVLGELTAEAKESDSTLATMRPLDSLKVGLIRNPILLMLAAPVAFIGSNKRSLLEHFFPEVPSLDEIPIQINFIDWYVPWPQIEVLNAELLVSIAIVALLLIVGSILLLVLLALLISLIFYHQFRLTLEDDTLRVESGAFTRVDKKTPLYRVQLLQTVRSDIGSLAPNPFTMTRQLRIWK